MLPTPHISAAKGDIAKTVLMPGDPLRAKFIAETFLTDVTCFNTVRGMLGFTGFYEGKRVSVMGSGMGIPSIGIYSHELFSFYDVDNIIRVGSAGGISKDMRLMDIVIAMGASTNSSFARQFELPGQYAPIASYKLLKKACDIAETDGVKVKVGNVLTSDTFYDAANSLSKWRSMSDMMCVEMETAALYMNAAYLGKNALSILTISDLPLGEGSLSSDDRERTFLEMMKIALKTA